MLDNFFASSVWEYSILSNTVYEITIASCVFLVAFFILKIFQMVLLVFLSRLAKKTKTDIDDTLIKIVSTLRPPFYLFVAFFVAVQFLTLLGIVNTIINAVLIVWITVQVVVATQILIDYIAQKYTKDEDNLSTQSAIDTLKLIVKGVLWMGAILTILSNLGVNITSLIAGLGIGGIAIALALQNILGDLFSSFAIYFDKPFQPGDLIIVGGHMGVVKKIGIKTTRIQSLQGEEIVISNKELTSAHIQNFKHMEERRASFSFGVEYGTDNVLLEEIPDIVKKIINSDEHARFDRAHFKSFGDSALNFEVVYYVDMRDFAIYMDTQQKINLGLKKIFEQKGIAMAFPTRTIHIQKGD